ncbi:amino acid ABC transporter permease [Adlercreutzia sp. ZJ473]|uniref:amino acid ABC transporter permease n=1 Tax=Adlercreutzia sp. ZJ473 TaxID=2722822 RepID=UPI0020A67B30|nr:amino acid ABC transporter permease [Adlercreutzia sp. ZJ473]
MTDPTAFARRSNAIASRVTARAACPRDARLAAARRLFVGVLMALALLCGAVLAQAAQPADALALDTAKCTARPNGDTGSEVYGATETRVTWEGQAAPGESLTALELTMPEGTTFGLDDARVMLLSGDNLMTRDIPDVEFSADGNTLRAVFAEPTAPGSYVRVEVYEVFFPAEGGAMGLAGSYTTAEGDTLPIDDIAPIQVTGKSAFDQLVSSLEQQDWVKQWNSNKFLRLFFNPPLIVSSIPVVFNGFLMAIGIVAVAFPVAIPIGLVLALMRMSKWRVLRGIATTYVNVVRGTPLFLQIYIAFFGLPLAGVQIPSFPLGVIVLSMNSAAYLCEIFRAGIQSIPKGQFEASRSLGMNGAQTMVFVIIPQTVRRVIPTMTSEFILLYKDTSMLAAVGVMEVVMYAKTIVASTGSITPYIVAACFYLIITLPLAKVVGKLESRLAGTAAPKKRRKKGAPAAAGVEGAGAAGANVGAGAAVTGTDSAGVTGFATDVLTAQPLLKNEPGDGLGGVGDHGFGMKNTK